MLSMFGMPTARGSELEDFSDPFQPQLSCDFMEGSGSAVT